MKIRMNLKHRSPSVEIDPIPREKRAAFVPSIVVHEATETSVLITTFGYLSSTEAGQYAEALMLASFFSDQASKGKSLIGIYQDIKLLIASQEFSALQTLYWPADTNDSLH